MSAPRRILWLASHAAVTLWLAAALAWTALDRPAPIQVAEASARVQPQPELPPEPEPVVEPEPEPEKKAEPEPEPEPPRAEPEPKPEPEEAPTEPAAVAAADVSKGAALLDGAGAFPVLSCSYEDFASFVDYARAMTALGARFVIVRDRAIVGGIDLETGTIGEAGLDAAFSPRARDYTGEPGLARLAGAARSRFGDGAIVMMLVPRALDAGLFGGIARALEDRGERHADYREIRGRYVRTADGSVRLRVDAGVRVDGSRREIDLLFDLSEIARADRAAGGRA